MLTLLIVPVQILLIAFAMRGFKQGWNVELERRDPELRRGLTARRGAVPRLRAGISSLRGNAAVAER